MDTLAIIKLAIFDGKLRPDEAPLAQDIIEQHGEATFAAFLTFRQQQKDDAQAGIQAAINKALGLPETVFAKYNH